VRRVVVAVPVAAVEDDQENMVVDNKEEEKEIIFRCKNLCVVELTVGLAVYGRIPVRGVALP
jgi:hypothetical protein